MSIPACSTAARTAADRRAPGDAVLPRVPWINHLRVPLALSGLLLLVFMPSIFRLSDSSYTAATGQQPDQYLANWLLVTAALFVLSAVAYAAQLRRASFE